MKRALRWLKRIVLGTLALAVVAVIAAVIVVHTDFGRRLIARQIEAALLESFPGGAKVGALEGSVFGTLVVRDLELSDLDQTPLVKVGSVKLELSLLPLFLKVAHLDSLVVEDVVITKHPQTLVAPPPPPPGSMTVEIPKLEVKRISAVIETATDTFTLENGSATASVMVMPGGFVTATANVAATWRERGAPIAVAVGAEVGDVIRVPFAHVAVGGVALVATAVDVDAMAGTITVHATPAVIATLVPGVELPGDVNLVVTTKPRTGAGLHAVIGGSVGTTAIHGAALADLATGSARGVIGVRGADLGALSKGAVQGNGTAILAASTDGLRVRATVLASGAVILPDGEVTAAAAATTEGTASAPIGGHVLAAIDATPQAGTALVLATGAGDSRVAVLGGGRRDGSRVLIDRTLIAAGTLDPGAASGGLAPISGALGVELVVGGTSDAITVEGRAHGARIAITDKRVGKATARFDATIKFGPDGPEVIGAAHAEIANVASAGSPLGSFTVDARSRSNRQIAVSGQARLAAAPVVVDASALVTLGEVIDIALGPHRVQTPKGELRGDGGSVRIGLRDIVVEGIQTAPVGAGNGKITVDATVGRESKLLIADLDVRDIPASLIDPAYRGTASADLSITRKRMKWSGGGSVVVRKFSLKPDTLPIDAEAKFSVANRRVVIEGRVSNPTVGGARVAVEVDGPRDLSDGAAWMKVKRGDLHSVTIGVERLDLAALTDDRTAGTADGTLVISAGVPSGTLAIRGVPTPAGTADADVTLSLTDVGFVDTLAKARVGAVGGADAEIRLQIPDRVFDPDAWKALGTAVIHRATVRTTEVAFDSRLLGQLGVDAPYSGRASAEIVVGTGGSSVELATAVRDLRGGPLKRGVDLAVTGRADAQGTVATAKVTSGRTTLLELPDARSPVTLDRWVANPRGELAAKIAGTVTIPRIPARELLAIIGRTDVLAGTLESKVAIGGTFAVPTASATLDVLGLKVRPRLVSKPPPMLTALHLDASWDGATAKLHMTGAEENKGSIEIDATVDPKLLAAAKATMKVKNFDLAPLVVFLPGPLVGASGKLEADLTIKRLDPSLGSVTGFVHLTDGRVPVAPILGTLRRGDLRIDIDDGGVTVKLDGRIGPGTVKLEATTTDLVNARVTGQVSKFSPITSLAPIIDARINGTFTREGMRWRGSAKIDRASVVVPEQAGQTLLEAAVPEDLIFVDRPIPLPKRIASAPERPWLVADLELASTRVTMPELQVVGSVSGQVEISVGESVGLDGQIGVETATLVITGHRYRVELGQVAFDGTTDALIDVKLAHDFPDVTTYVTLAGRTSAIDKIEPQFTSEPAIYSQGQLLGFFLGGAPGGDPSKQTAEAAKGLGASIASTVLGKRLKKVRVIGPLLEKVQVGCKPGAGQSSASCTAGTWVTKKTYVTAETRLDSRPDENTSQGKVEYYWKPNRTVELTGGDRGYFGLDLLWRHRW